MPLVWRKRWLPDSSFVVSMHWGAMRSQLSSLLHLSAVLCKSRMYCQLLGIIVVVTEETSTQQDSLSEIPGIQLSPRRDTALSSSHHVQGPSLMAIAESWISHSIIQPGFEHHNPSLDETR